MAIAEAIVGARKIGQIIAWYDRNDQLLDITGAEISAVIEDVYTGVERESDGAFDLYTDGGDGLFTWGYGAADVSEHGRFLVQFQATFPDEKFALSRLEPWFVHRALVAD